MNVHCTASRRTDLSLMTRILGTALLAGCVGAGFSWGAGQALGVDAWIAAVVSGVLLFAIVGGLMLQERRRGTASRSVGSRPP
jgi:hypothetical protein